MSRRPFANALPILVEINLAWCNTNTTSEQLRRWHQHLSPPAQVAVLPPSQPPQKGFVTKQFPGPETVPPALLHRL